MPIGKPPFRLTLVLFSVLMAALAYFLLPPNCPEPARRTAFVFVMTALFWAFEVIPLYATALVVVVSLIFSLAKPEGVLGMDENGYQIFLLPFSNPVIMLFLGGFVLAAMMRKYGVDQIVVSRLLRLFGEKPYFILLGFIFTTGFVSLWMSHTASTALMLVMIGPVLSRLGSGDHFKKALVLAIPFSANIAGIGTPVATPPNAIAIGILAEHGIRIKFLSWMLMAIPLAVILLFAASVVLYVMFPPRHKKIQIALDDTNRLDAKGLGAILIGFLTVFLWISSDWHGIPESVVSLLAVSLFAATGLLNREDLNTIHWDILVLMWGGLALGKAMEVSELNRWIISLPFFSQEGFLLVAAFCLVTVLLSIFVSNTATANLILPLAMSVPEENRLLLGVIVALSCSFDMLLPISTPSNALAFSTNAIATKDMIKSGLVIVVIAVALLLSGYPFFINQLLRL